jgi:hypothetical protein
MNHLGQFYSLDPIIYEEQIPHPRISVNYLSLPRNISTKARIALQQQGKIFILKDSDSDPKQKESQSSKAL